MILNEKLRQIIIRNTLYNHNLPHDRWTFWCGFFAGKIITDDRMLVTYRRHDGTVTITGKGNWILLKEWWRNDINGDQMANWERIGVLFTDLYREEMNYRFSDLADEWRILLKSKPGIAAYFRRLTYPKRLKPTLAGELILRISFLLNK